MIAGAGDRFAVDFRCFTFRSRVDLADLARIFGTELVSLNTDNQAKLEGEPFLCIGITRTFPGSYFHGSVRSRTAPQKLFRCHRRLGQLQVAVGVWHPGLHRHHWYVSRIVLFADQSAHKSFREKSYVTLLSS